MVVSVYVCEHCGTKWDTESEDEVCEADCARRSAAKGEVLHG